MGYVNILIKPASSLCNMRCRYCFYADESEHRMQKSMGIMTAETSRQLIDAMFTAAGILGAVNFSFQGGEPTMAGLDFFREFVAMARERNRENLPVSWAMQTNGLNLNGEWAAFLKENHFLMGISVDGGRALHDRFRPDAAGNGTFPCNMFDTAVKVPFLLRCPGLVQVPGTMTDAMVSAVTCSPRLRN